MEMNEYNNMCRKKINVFNQILFSRKSGCFTTENPFDSFPSLYRRTNIVFTVKDIKQKHMGH